MSARPPSSQTLSKSKVDFIQRNKENLAALSQRSKSAGKHRENEPFSSKKTYTKLQIEDASQSLANVTTPVSLVIKPTKKTTPIPPKLKPMNGNTTSEESVYMRSSVKIDMELISEEPEPMIERSTPPSPHQIPLASESLDKLTIAEAQLPQQSSPDKQPSIVSQAVPSNPSEVFTTFPSPAFTQSQTENPEQIQISYMNQTPCQIEISDDLYSQLIQSAHKLSSAHSQKMMELEERKQELAKSLSSSNKRVRDIITSIHQEQGDFASREEEGIRSQRLSPSHVSRLSFSSQGQADECQVEVLKNFQPKSVDVSPAQIASHRSSCILRESTHSYSENRYRSSEEAANQADPNAYTLNIMLESSDPGNDAPIISSSMTSPQIASNLSRQSFQYPRNDSQTKENFRVVVDRSEEPGQLNHVSPIEQPRLSQASKPSATPHSILLNLLASEEAKTEHIEAEDSGPKRLKGELAVGDDERCQIESPFEYYDDEEQFEDEFKGDIAEDSSKNGMTAHFRGLMGPAIKRKRRHDVNERRKRRKRMKLARLGESAIDE